MTAKADTREADWIKYQSNLQAIQQLQNENIILVARIKDWKPPVDESDDEFWNTAKIAEKLGMSDQQVRNLMTTGAIKGYAGGQSFRARKQDVLEYMERELVIHKDTAFKKAMAR